MKFLSVFIAAIAVVPLPIQLSSTVSPSFEYVLIRYSKSATGFWVGWMFLLIDLFIFKTLLGFLYPVSLFLVLTTLFPKCCLLVVGSLTTLRLSTFPNLSYSLFLMICSNSFFVLEINSSISKTLYFCGLRSEEHTSELQ